MAHYFCELRYSLQQLIQSDQLLQDLKAVVPNLQFAVIRVRLVLPQGAAELWAQAQLVVTQHLVLMLGADVEVDAVWDETATDNWSVEMGVNINQRGRPHWRAIWDGGTHKYTVQTLGQGGVKVIGQRELQAAAVPDPEWSDDDYLVISDAHGGICCSALGGLSVKHQGGMRWALFNQGVYIGFLQLEPIRYLRIAIHGIKVPHPQHGHVSPTACFKVGGDRFLRADHRLELPIIKNELHIQEDCLLAGLAYSMHYWVSPSSMHFKLLPEGILVAPEQSVDWLSGTNWRTTAKPQVLQQGHILRLVVGSVLVSLNWE
jgi:hypothetical protein